MNQSVTEARALYRANRAEDIVGKLATHLPSSRACRVLADAWLPGCVLVRWLTQPGSAVVHRSTLQRLERTEERRRDLA